MNSTAHKTLITVLSTLLYFPFPAYSETTTALNHVKTKVEVTQEGTLASLKFPKETIDLFKGRDAGPIITMATAGRPEQRLLFHPGGSSGKQEAGFVAKVDQLDFNLKISVPGDYVDIRLDVSNTGDQPANIHSLNMQLGIDTCMIKFPEWNEKHFPSFLRNEKTHFWGYAMSPSGSIVGIFSPDPVASWSLNYNKGGHRINGINLELMTSKEQPGRFQATDEARNTIKPGATRSWSVVLAPCDQWQNVPALAARHAEAPFVTADRYTGEPGEQVTLSLYGEPDEVVISSLSGQAEHFPVKGSSLAYTLPEDPGYYSVSVIKKVAGGKPRESTAMLTVRRPWSWYMLRSREWAVKSKQKAGSHTEGWYGFFPAFITRRYFPDNKLDRQLDADFNELFPTMYDYDKKVPTAPSHPKRIQNHACAASLFAGRYQITGDIKDMEMASALCDFIVKTQKEDGAYRNGKTHYTSVIYVAKSIMEVMPMEQELGKKEPRWQEAYERHYASVNKAVDELVRNLDNIQTEGEMTFEDGMISCSYTQIAEWARRFAKPEERQKYIDAAETLVSKHRCLSQLLQPDSRMNGGSLRFWESQYDVLWGKNLMSSPHGWSAWRLYGLFDLYRLTGKVDYLRQAMNGMGSCANLIDPVSGELRWAFMVDPSITADVFEPSPADPKGQYVNRTLGECYVPMISSWLKAPYGKPVFGYSRNEGGSCDNDVQEIFKCLGEHALTTTWLHIDETGKPEAWNGKVTRDGDTYTVTPSESVVSEIHVNTSLPTKIRISRQGVEKVHTLKPGMTSIPG